MNIPAEAVEASAELVAVEMGTPSTPHIYRHLARKTLEAAAPYMLRDAKSEAWAEGHEDGFWNGRLSHGDPEALTGIEHARATNPYRSQA